jgi:hypothetical protein
LNDNINEARSDNKNWTILVTDNGDLSSATEIISAAYNNGSKINNIVLNSHGWPNWVAAGYDINGRWFGLGPNEINKYAANGDVLTRELNEFLCNIYLMASYLSKTGNFIINACNLGRTDRGGDLGAALFNYLKSANSEINIFLPRYEQSFATNAFEKPLNQSNNGWSITNKWTNGHSVEVTNSNIILHKKGAPVEISSNLDIYRNK